MRVTVGGTLTIKGRHFKSKARQNTVIFRASNGRSAFVKPRRASRSKLVITVGERVARLLTVKSSAQKPTRLKLRVLAGKFSSFTSKRLSPVVVGLSSGPGDGGGGTGGGGNVCEDDSDHDNDLLSNSLEKSLGTDPCLEDTDGDGMIDGWEYYAAKDLNLKAVPYPSKRPYPNALDPSDGKAGTTSRYDFDGDGLHTYEEYRAWRVSGRSFVSARIGGADALSPLGYSDGTQTSESSTLDDLRDADSDGLGNFSESNHGPGQVAWWPAYWADVGVDPWPDTYYGAFDEVPYQGLDLADNDVDGDGVLDGADDQDHDDWSNAVELSNAGGQIDVGGGTMRYVNAFNPCAPTESRTCDRHPPIGG
jgi:hypothetical protein